MTERFGIDEIAPLLRIGEDDADAEVRAAALGAAVALPLGREGWQQVARALLRLIRDAPVGSAARRQALHAALRVPLRSMRASLRNLADDADDADRDLLLSALDLATGKSRVAATHPADTVRVWLRGCGGLLAPGITRDDKLRMLRFREPETEAGGPEFDAGGIFELRRGRGVGLAQPIGRVVPRSRSQTAATTPDPAEPDESPPDGEQRRVNAQILHGGQLRRSFVSGADNVIRCWIGLPESERAASADRPVPQLAIPVEGLELTAELYWNDQRDSKRLILPAERGARSGDCDLRLHVPAGERFVSAEIMFRYRGRAFEVVRVEAFALEAGDAEQAHHQIQVRVQASRREVVELADSKPVDSTFVFGDDRRPAAGGAAQPAALRVFGGEGGKGGSLGYAALAIRWISDTLFATEKLVVRRKAAQAAGGVVEEVLDADDPDVRTLLRDMARHGAGLYNQLRDNGFTDPGDRIQVLNLDPDAYVPLEFVYDRGYPLRDASLCAPGLAALQEGEDACPVCATPAADEERAAAPVVCPFGFWSLRKVIERVAPADDGQISVPAAGRRALPAIDAVAFASSHLVPENERMATRDALQQRPGKLVVADDWQQWRAALKTQPPLLVVLPHHGVQAALDYLEIGDPQQSEDLGRLSHAQIGRPYVNPDARDPGPIVLLLGCQTGAETETGYVQITRRIQQQRASIVLGTLAQILGRHAAPLARELVAELVAVDDAEADFGTIMRRVRRRMLARGYLMALCLVALGDAEWRLTPRPPMDGTIPDSSPR